MVFKRRGARSYCFQARLPNGRYVQLSTGAPRSRAGKGLAQRIEAMWESLAVEHRAWDLLAPVLQVKRRERVRRLHRLYDLWEETKRTPVDIRRKLSDVNIEPLIAEFERWYAQYVQVDTVRHAIVHLRVLLPERTPLLLSEVTSAWLAQQLASYPGTRNTKRRVHSHWSRFFGYLVRVHQLLFSGGGNPMDQVERPTEQRHPIRFYELETAERIVAAQPTPARRALFALLYGCGLECGTALRLTRGDVWETTQEIRAAGTKTLTRDRVCTVSDWAWPNIREYVHTLLPAAPLFPGFRVDVVWHWHRQTTETLKLPEHLKVHAARHHWAVLALRAGTPVRLVQTQLGHGHPNLTLSLYGAFVPGAEDRAEWRARVTRHEQKRRESRQM